MHHSFEKPKTRQSQIFVKLRENIVKVINFSIKLTRSDVSLLFFTGSQCPSSETSIIFVSRNPKILFISICIFCTCKDKVWSERSVLLSTRSQFSSSATWCLGCMLLQYELRLRFKNCKLCSFLCVNFRIHGFYCLPLPKTYNKQSLLPMSIWLYIAWTDYVKTQRGWNVSFDHL